MSGPGIVLAFLPKKPERSDDYTENELAELVMRDATIGVIPVTIDNGRIT